MFWFLSSKGDCESCQIPFVVFVRNGNKHSNSFVTFACKSTQAIGSRVKWIFFRGSYLCERFLRSRLTRRKESQVEDA